MRRITFLGPLLLLALPCCGMPSTELGRAADDGNLPAVQNLLAAGANPNAPVHGHEISPLAIACRIGRPDMVAALLDAGASPEQRSGINGWTPLVHAVHRRQTGTVELLLARTHPGPASLTQALTMAAGYGTSEVVHRLLEAGAQPTTDTLTDAVGGSWDIDGEWNGCGPHTETVRALLATSPDLRLPETRAGRAALRFARKKGCTEMLSLVEGGLRAAR